MDDIKLYAKSERDIDSLIHITRIYSNDTVMSYWLEKCSEMVTRRGKAELSELHWQKATMQTSRTATSPSIPCMEGFTISWDCALSRMKETSECQSHYCFTLQKNNDKDTESGSVSPSVMRRDQKIVIIFNTLKFCLPNFILAFCLYR